MLPIVVLAGCGAMDPAGSRDGSLPTDGAGEDGPALALTAPARASLLPVGPVTVGGVARGVTGVTVNGQPATQAAGQFALELPLALGVNTFEVAAVDAAGAPLADTGAVLAGAFAPPSGLVRDAVQVHVSAAGLAAAGPLVAGLIEPTAFHPAIQALNPLIDTAEAKVLLGDLSFGPPEVALVPVDGAIDLTVRLPDFVLPVEATVYDALPFGIDLDLGVDLAADEVVLHARIAARPDGQGGLVVEVGALEAELAAFDLDTGILELVDWLFVDDDELAAVIEAELAGLGPTIEDLVAGLIDDLDRSLETEVFGRTLTVGPSFDAVAIDPAGVAVALGIAVDVTGAPEREGHLFVGAPPPGAGGEVHVQVADDLLNRALHELWAAGALDLDLALEGELAAVSVLFGGQGGGNLSMRAALPPVWVEQDGAARLQLGELALTVDTPGGSYGERVELVLTLDARAELAITAEAAGLALSDARVIARPAGGSVGNAVLAAELDQIETTFALGVGLLNGLLSFPLDGVVPPGTALPALAPARDPSGRGTVLDLAVADLAGLLGASGSAPPATPPNDVPVPAAATVHPEDETVAADGAVGWVCPDAEVLADGDNGTWYVEGDATLALRGTGHVVYATDGAEVVLDGPGNTVWADPGADVQDDDGTNAVTILDPLNLDRAGAPTPGCGG